MENKFNHSDVIWDYTLHCLDAWICVVGKVTMEPGGSLPRAVWRNLYNQQRNAVNPQMNLKDTFQCSVESGELTKEPGECSALCGGV